jgi:hypothetical protein
MLKNAERIWAYYEECRENEKKSHTPFGKITKTNVLELRTLKKANIRGKLKCAQ